MHPSAESLVVEQSKVRVTLINPGMCPQDLAGTFFHFWKWGATVTASTYGKSSKQWHSTGWSGYQEGEAFPPFPLVAPKIAFQGMCEQRTAVKNCAWCAAIRLGSHDFMLPGHITGREGGRAGLKGVTQRNRDQSVF